MGIDEITEVLGVRLCNPRAQAVDGDMELLARAKLGALEGDESREELCWFDEYDFLQAVCPQTYHGLDSDEGELDSDAEFEEEVRGLDALVDRFCLRMRQRLQAALVAERSERSPDAPAHARALGICVEVPAGAQPGDYLRVQYGGAIVPFTVPVGASAGSRVCVEALSAGLGAAHGHASPIDRALDMRRGVRQAVSDARASSAAPSAARGSSRKRAR